MEVLFGKAQVEKLGNLPARNPFSFSFAEEGSRQRSRSFLVIKSMMMIESSSPFKPRASHIPFK